MRMDWLALRRSGSSVVIYGLLVWAVLALSAAQVGSSGRAGFASHDGSPLAMIWPAGGFLLARLLNVQRREAVLTLIAAGLLKWGLHRAYGLDWLGAFVISGLAAAEIGLAAVLLRLRLRIRPDPTRPGALALVLAASLIAAGFSALFAAEFLYFLKDVSFRALFLDWFASGMMGFVVVTPAVLACFRLESAGRQLLAARNLLVFLPPAFTLFLLLANPTMSGLLFLIFPPLLLIANLLDFNATALSLLLTITVICGVNFSGHGPLEHQVAAGLLSRHAEFHLLQLFLLALAVTVYFRAANQAQMVRLRGLLAERVRRFRDSERRYRALAENSRDIIFRVSPDGRRLYVSPAVTEMLGWSVGEQLGQDWRRDVHPADWPAVRAALKLLQAGNDHTVFTYRRLRKDGSYLWVETRVRAVRERASGRVVEFVATTRDVSVQKAAEEKLNAVNAELAALAATDGLTGIPNRRAFDAALEAEWRRAQREGTPLALLMIDVDHFKIFNDFYGHLQGDECLKRLATTLRAAMHRGGDFAARFGGEEFTVLLPATSAAGALEVAERIHDAVRDLGITHELVATGQVTLSIGVAIQAQRRYGDVATLLAGADSALYAAKRRGRNCTFIVSGPGMVAVAAELPDMVLRQSTANTR